MKVNNECKGNIRYVGIHGHYIDLAEDNDTENVFKCWVSFTSEMPFRQTVYLSVGKKPLNSENYHLQWEISKEKWDKIKDAQQPWRLKLSPDKLILV